MSAPRPTKAFDGSRFFGSDHEPPAQLVALQYQADGQWRWTCDAGGYVIGFTEADLESVGELPTETRRVPWVDVPARLKRLSEVGNRKARRAERSERRREAWAAHKKAEGRA